MAASDFLFYDGQLRRNGQIAIEPDNRSFRYGDGCFETMRVINDRLILRDFHFERLLQSIERLRFEPPVFFNSHWLEEQVLRLVRANGHQRMARVRLMVFRGPGGVYDPQNHYPHHLIESWELNPATQQWNENGLVMDVFRDARKVCDQYSMLKSNNYLPYLMAALWAKENKLNDAILLNPYDRLADCTIANLFLVKDGMILTPSLEEGPVNGVMRRHLLHSFRKAGIPVTETQIPADSLLEASEIFITNAIHGIRWVKQVGGTNYTGQLAADCYRNFVQPLLH